MKKLAIPALALALCTATFVGCPALPDYSILGKWQHINTGEAELTFQFNTNGTFEVVAIEPTWIRGLRGTYSINQLATPKEIDLHITQIGSGTTEIQWNADNQTLYGIYELQGSNTLGLVYASVRPTELTSGYFYQRIQ